MILGRCVPSLSFPLCLWPPLPFLLPQHPGPEFLNTRAQDSSSFPGTPELLPYSSFHAILIARLLCARCGGSEGLQGRHSPSLPCFQFEHYSEDKCCLGTMFWLSFALNGRKGLTSQRPDTATGHLSHPGGALFSASLSLPSLCPPSLSYCYPVLCSRLLPGYSTSGHQ